MARRHRSERQPAERLVARGGAVTPATATRWAAEKAARLKPNGRLRQRSPLSSVIELESLLLGIEGKRACWRVLRRQAQVDQRLDPAQLDDLTARAEQQLETVEGLRIEAAAEAFG